MMHDLTERRTDAEQARLELRSLSRADLLLIANRAVDLLPDHQVQWLFEGLLFIQAREAAPPALIDQVRAFHDRSCRGEYFDDTEPGKSDRQSRSRGTDAFLAEFHRLAEACVRDAVNSLAGFELLFDLLRRLDTDPDDVVYFFDEPGSFHVGVDWASVLPAYFQGLARAQAPEAYLKIATAVIQEFVPQDLERSLALAKTTASREAPNASQAL
jgi:hypothetical protein